MFLLFVIGGGGFWTGWAAHRSISDDKPITKENSEVTRVANERTAAITTATEPPFPLPPSDGETPTPPPGDKALKSPNTDRASHQSSGAATGVKQATELAEKLSRGNPFPDLDPTSDGNPTATGVKQATELAEKLSRENSWPK
jgi:hypothetical protein